MKNRMTVNGLISQQRRDFLQTYVFLLLPDFDVVWQQPPVDGLSGVGHEGPAFKAGLLEEPG